VPWVWIFGVLAALFNPILPVHLQRDTWQIVDWGAIGVIVVAAISFSPHWKEWSVIVSGNQAEVLDISKARIAREWLIFLGTLPLGFLTCFFLRYFLEHWGDPAPLSNAFNGFYYQHFGLGRVSSLPLWFAPYLALVLIRSVIWSVSTVRVRANLKQEASYSLVALYLIAAFWFGALVIKNVQDQAAKGRPAETKQDGFTKNAPKSDSTLLAAGDLERVHLSAIGSSAGPQGLSSVWGAVRNDLTHPVEKVQLKVLVYDSAGRLIASRTFILQNSRLDPGVPIMFNQGVALNNLPTDYQSSIQVIEAHFAQPVSASTTASTEPSEVSLTPPPGDHSDLGLQLGLIIVPTIGVLAIALTIFLTIRSKPPPKPPPLPDPAAKSH
jgi:hypothetical protein